VPPSGGKASKWQPLSTADPDPVADHDPFSLGDSDDEESRKKETRGEDSERSKQAAGLLAPESAVSGNRDPRVEERTATLGTLDKGAGT
jgi:hypothetical protein